MDETLRRRLVGAVVLLGAAFLLASLLPDRRQGPLRGPLPPPAPRIATAPAAMPEPVAEVEVEPGVEPEASEPDDLPPAGLQLEERLRDPARWYVQIGSFGEPTNASKVQQRLTSAGLAAFTEVVQVDRKLWYRVRVPYDGEAGAQDGLRAVRAQGYAQARIVRPDSPPAP